MAARYIIFDGHIPVVFPNTLPPSMLGCKEDSRLDEGMRVTAQGLCYYSEERGWLCSVETDAGLIHDKQSSETLNRHLCN